MNSSLQNGLGVLIQMAGLVGVVLGFILFVQVAGGGGPEWARGFSGQSTITIAMIPVFVMIGGYELSRRALQSQGS